MTELLRSASEAATGGQRVSAEGCVAFLDQIYRAFRDPGPW
ncbi:hypothetical protein LJR084_006711 [Variovorax sp. LjRoot84]